MFVDAEVRIWSDVASRSGSLEGGDIVVIGNRSLMVGLGERSSPAAVAAYAHQLVAAGAADRVLVIFLPTMRQLPAFNGPDCLQPLRITRAAFLTAPPRSQRHTG